MADLEVNINVKAKLTRVIGDEWSVELLNVVPDSPPKWINTMHKVTPAELNSKLGVKVAKTVVAEDALSRAEELVQEALTEISGAGNVSASEMQDRLLDIKNMLKDANKETFNEGF